MKKLTVTITCERSADGSTEIITDVSGQTSERDMGNIMLALGRSFGLSAEQWAALALCARFGMTAIGGIVREETGTGVRLPVKDMHKKDGSG